MRVGIREASRQIKEVTKKTEKLVDMIIDYESGELPAENTMELFSGLVKSGMAWTLQGHYGRISQSLIDNGYLDKQGNILKGGKK